LVAIDSFDIFVICMKIIKHLAVVSAILLSMLISFDDSISLFFSVDAIEIPVYSDCSDVTHHHHFSLTDHFFQKNSISDSNIVFAPGFRLFLVNHTIADHFLSSIWQPPQRNC